MTRETKIGLIVGLGVIIFIGILISDYLSVAQQQQAADIDQLTMQEDERAQPAGNPYNLNALNNRGPAHGRSQQTPPRNDAFEADRLVMNTRDLDQLTGNRPDAQQTDEQGGYTPYTPSQQQAVQQVQPQQEVRLVQQAPPPVSRRTIHHVGDGETLYEIAEQHYGNGNLWRLIHEANADKIPNPDRLRKGVALTIPDRQDAQPQTVQQVDPRPIPEPTVTRTYTIQRGDSLSKIAERYFGSQRDLNKLLELNRETIDDPDRIRVGMEIRVPAR